MALDGNTTLLRKLFFEFLSVVFVASVPCLLVVVSLVLVIVLGTLRSEDGNGRENVAEKVNSRSFNLHRDYSKSLTLSNIGEPSLS